MDDEKPRKSNHGGIVTALVLLPVFYVLSFGPVIRLSYRHVSSSTLWKIYFPVSWLHEHTILKKPLEQYAKLWGI